MEQKLYSHLSTDYSLATDVTGFKIVFANVYMIGEPVRGGKWVLVDAGLPGSASKIKKEAARLFGTGIRPEAIVLTHGHFDHTGAIETLAEEWDVPIYAHGLEMPYLTGKSHYPPPDPAAGVGGMSYMSFLYPTAPVDLGHKIRCIQSDRIPELPGWQIIHTPGHAPGHISLFREEDRVLIAGDAFTTVRQESVRAVITQKKEIHGPPSYFTIDWNAAAQSVRKLAALHPSAAGTGHGLPMFGKELSESLNELAANFETMAVPPKGRYTKQPAVTNGDGIVSMPRPVSYRVTKGLALAGLAAMAGGMVYCAIRSSKKR